MNKETISRQLNRVISLRSGILMVMGIMIGTGIFKKVAPMATSGLSAGWIIAAWVVAGLVTLLGGLTVSALAGLTDESGGEYEYLRILFGRFTAFMFGWACFTIIGSASIAAVAFIFTQSLQNFFSIGDPLHSWADLSPGFGIFPFADSGIKLIAVLVIVLLSYINFRGTKEGTLFNNGVTYAKIGGVLLVVIAGFFLTGKVEQPGLLIHNNSLANMNFFSAFFAAMLSAFWAYDGWLNVSFISGELKEPQRNLPKAIVRGILLVIVIYVLINAAILNVTPTHQLAALSENEVAATVMMKTVAGKTGEVFLSVLLMLCSLGALNGLILTYARMYYKMAQDGLFFKPAALVHATHQTPHVSLWISMLMSCLLVFSGTFDMLTNMAIFGGFLFYVLLAIGLIRWKQQGRIAAKKIGYPWVPVLFILFSTVLLINTLVTETMQSFMGIGLMFSGLPFYFWFNRKRL